MTTEVSKINYDDDDDVDKTRIHSQAQKATVTNNHSNGSNQLCVVSLPTHKFVRPPCYYWLHDTKNYEV
jgi:hypothetical protein